MKILFGVILSLSVVNFAQAGEMTVTGSAEATILSTGSGSSTAKNDTGKALGISNELAFTANGEFGNGYTWKYQIELDPNKSTGLAKNDDTRLEMTAPYGTLGLYNSEGDLNTQLKYNSAAYAPGHDYGNTGKMQAGKGMNSYNNIQYHTPSDLLPYNTSVKVAYSNGDAYTANDAANTGDTTTSVKSVLSYQVISSPMDGLTVGASYLTEDGSGSTTIQEYETGGAFAKYSTMGFTVGAARHLVAPNHDNAATGNVALTTSLVTGTANTINANVEYFENTSYGIGYAVNDNLSVSYDTTTSTAKVKDVVITSAVDKDTDRDLEFETIQVAYNMGGAVITLAKKEIEGNGYAADNDISEWMVGLKMAF